MKKPVPFFWSQRFQCPPRGYGLGAEQLGTVAYLSVRKTGSMYCLLVSRRIQGAPAPSTVTQGAASHE